MPCREVEMTWMKSSWDSGEGIKSPDAEYHTGSASRQVRMCKQNPGESTGAIKAASSAQWC